MTTNEKLQAVRARLIARFQTKEFTLNDVLNEIRKEGLPPFKTRDKMLRLDFIRFVGKHSQDQRYIT